MDLFESSGYIIDSRFPNNKIHETAVIGNNVEIGEGNIILPYVVIGQAGFIRDSEKPEGTIVIGNNNRIGCFVNIMAGQDQQTVIGSDNLIMNHVNIGHNVKIGNGCEVGAGTILNGWSTIGNEVKIKSSCAIRNRIFVSDKIIVGQRSNVVSNLDLEDSLYHGNPAKFIKRNTKIKLK